MLSNEPILFPRAPSIGWLFPFFMVEWRFLHAKHFCDNNAECWRKILMVFESGSKNRFAVVQSSWFKTIMCTTDVYVDGSKCYNTCICNGVFSGFIHQLYMRRMPPRAESFYVVKCWYCKCTLSSAKIHTFESKTCERDNIVLLWMRTATRDAQWKATS